MGAEEGAAGPGIVTTGAPKHVRHNRPGSPTALDCRSVARYVPVSERRFWIIQPDRGPPWREIHASSRSQGRVFRGRLPERPTKTAPRVSGSDRPPGQANPCDDWKHDLWRVGQSKGSRLGSCLPGHGATLGKGGWETQIHLHLPIPLSLVRGPRSAYDRQGGGLPDGQEDGRILDHPGSRLEARNGRR